MSIRHYFEEYFNGEKNLMTPNVYGYDNKVFKDVILLFEKSEGKGIYDEDLFGCTVLLYNKKTNEVQQIELCHLFYKKEDVEKYINSITAKDVEAANRYGEIKKIYGVT